MISMILTYDFKLELPPLHTLHGLAELYEAIALQVYYYNTGRIHTAFGMSPAAYAASLMQPKSLDKVSGKTGG